MNKIKNRLLGTNEKVFWVLDQKTTTQFAIVAEIEGHYEDQAWRTALDEVQKRHPSLSVQISGNDYSEARFQHSGHCPIPLKIFAMKDNSESWNSIIEEELSQPIDMAVAPLARAVLIQQPGQCVFMFLSNHSIGDGMSAALTVRDIVGAVSGKAIRHPAPSLSLDELAGVLPVKMDLGRKEGFEQVEKKVLPRPAIAIERHKLSGDLTLKLIERAKTEGTTVHGALSAAAIMALKKINPALREKPIRILHPLSARKTLGIGEAYGLFINIATLAYDPRPQQHFWSLAREIREGIAPLQTPDWIRADIEATGALFSNGLQVAHIEEALHQGTAHELMLTNLGNLSLEPGFDSLRIKSLWGPMVLTPHEAALTIGVATLNGELTLTLTGLAPSGCLLQKVEEILYWAC
jgi:hypothetical protein